jgi:phage protein D
MSDSDIGMAIFGDQEYGFEPVVVETNWRRQEMDQKVIQRGTDIRFLKHLARRNGFECYVEANPNTGRLEGHFHPPRLEQEPQGVLSVSLSSATNANSFNARFNMIQPATAQAKGLDIETLSDQQAHEESISLPGLGKDPTLTGDRPRKVLLSQTGLFQTSELQTCARAVVDRSCWAVTAEGDLNTVAYGGILRAKRPVLVRGAGRKLSGAYYVEKVLHVISGEGYTQRFTLRRNATGLTNQENFAASILERL